MSTVDLEMVPAGTPEKPENLGTPENIEELASIVQTEAGSLTYPAKLAVAYVVVNRMRRRGSVAVKDVERGFASFARPSDESRRAARGALAGDVPDPTHGATHFYTPAAMPKEGQFTRGRDVGGGLESVQGVTEYNTEIPVRNYRPSWSVKYPEIKVPSVPQSQFKFFRAPAGESIP